MLVSPVRAGPPRPFISKDRPALQSTQTPGHLLCPSVLSSVAVLLSEGCRSPFLEKASFPSGEGGVLKRLLQLTCSVPILAILYFTGRGWWGGNMPSGQAHTVTVFSSRLNGPNSLC